MATRRRFNAAQLRAQRAFAARYGGKKRKTSRPAPDRQVATTRSPRPTMARRRFAKARSAARGIASGVQTRSILAGAVAGAAAGYGAKVLGKYGPALAFGGVGVVMKNPTLQTIAGVQLGVALASGLPGTAFPSSGVL